VNAKKSKEREQHPCNGIIDIARLAIQGQDKERIDDPANAEKSEGKKIDCTRYGLAKIETVRTGEPEQL